MTIIMNMKIIILFSIRVYKSAYIWKQKFQNMGLKWRSVEKI